MNELYLVRALVLPAATFALLYALLSVVSAAAWRMLRTRRNSAGLLYAVLVGPFALSALLVGALIVPSYLRFEPVSTTEELSGALVVLALAGAAVLTGGMVRAAIAWRRTATAVRRWKSSPVDAPSVVMTGIVHSELLVSQATERMLTPSELDLVKKHEQHHAHSHDNLRRLLLSFRVAPGFAAVESAWKNACELAADRAAVSSREEAVELASALVKVSRLGVIEAPLATNFASPAAELLELRVRQLMEWSPEVVEARHRIYVYLSMAGMFALVGVEYATILRAMHAICEWLVR